MSNGEDEVQVPIVQEEFANFMRKYRVAKGGEMCDIIAENIGETGGASTFEDAELLAAGLAKWSEYIGAPLRKQLLEHWCSKKNLKISEKALEAAGVTSKTADTLKKKQKKEDKEAEGAVWTVEMDGSGVPKMRMIKDESEPGVTFNTAKAALKDMGSGQSEPIVVYKEDLGRHMPNWKSPFAMQNPTAAWATAKMMDKAAAEGDVQDPMDVFIEQQAKMSQMKELIGVSGEPKEKSTVGEIVSALKDLQAMAQDGKVTGLPDWVTNPVEFLKTVQDIAGGEDKGGGPGWTKDPVEFIKMVREIAGEGKGDESVKLELAELKKTLDDMKEERHKAELAGIAGQIKTMQDSHERQMHEVLERLEEARKPTTGRTEMDIIHEVASGALEEAKGLRTDIRGAVSELIGGGKLPSMKSDEQREGRKVKYRQALQKDERIEELTKKLFFKQ